MISVTTRGGTALYPRYSTGYEILNNFYDENVVLMDYNGVYVDLVTPLEVDAVVDFIDKYDTRAARTVRNSVSRVLAEAMMLVYPEVKTSTACTREAMFFYEFVVPKDESIDLERVKRKMDELVERNAVFNRFVVDRVKTTEYFTTVGEFEKLKILEGIPIQVDAIGYSQGSWWDLCKGPNVYSVGQLKDMFAITGSMEEPYTDTSNLKKVFCEVTLH